MKALCLAIGNPLRGDDGVAHRVAERLAHRRDLVVCSVLQLTPELATEVARAETVVFVDADVEARTASIEAVRVESGRGSPLGHSMSPPEIVRLAERLYGFAGRAYLCRIPVESFDREGLSLTAETGAADACRLLTTFVVDNIR
jgi:hydrogenase maturation protease